MIAAAYFNKLAAERGLHIRAVARAVIPQPELSASTAAGLQKDGIEYSRERPVKLSEVDLNNTERLVTFIRWQTFRRTFGWMRSIQRGLSTPYDLRARAGLSVGSTAPVLARIEFVAMDKCANASPS